MSNYNSIPDPINGWGAVFPANMPITIPTEFSQCATYMQQILYLMAYKQPKLINGANVSITDNPDGTQTISVAGEAEGIVTLRVNPAITLPAGSEPRVENVGTNSNVILQFYLPEGMQGLQGETGADAVVEVGSVISVPSTSPASITNSGTPGHAILNFAIPRGADGTNGVDGAAGENATIAIGATITGEPGTDASVRNVGTPTNAILSFTIPEGRAGRDGSDGRDGVAGAAATITIGSVTTLPAGSNAQVTNSGTPTAAVLNFALPVGDTGATGETGPAGADGQDGENGQNGADGQDGENATITIGTVTTLPAGSQATVTNVGTETDAVLNFGIPKGTDGADGQGVAATVTVGSVTTLPAGSQATVANSGNEAHAVLNFGIPAGRDGTNGSNGTNGADGVSPTVTVGSVTTLPAGSSATVTNSGSSSAVVLDFGIPVGATGETGAAGQDGQNGQNGVDGRDGVSPTITVGNVSTLPEGSSAVVTNSGTSSNVILNFGIPVGATGATGAQGVPGPTSDASAEYGQVYIGQDIDSEGYISTHAFSGNGGTLYVGSDAGNWAILRHGGNFGRNIILDENPHFVLRTTNTSLTISQYVNKTFAFGGLELVPAIRQGNNLVKLESQFTKTWYQPVALEGRYFNTVYRYGHCMAKITYDVIYTGIQGAPDDAYFSITLLAADQDFTYPSGWQSDTNIIIRG